MHACHMRALCAPCLILCPFFLHPRLTRANRTPIRRVGDWNSQAKRLENVDFVQKAFESFDVDKSGFLDPQELRAALTMLGVKPSLDALKDMGIDDRDGDGTLSLQDLDTDGSSLHHLD